MKRTTYIFTFAAVIIFLTGNQCMAQKSLKKQAQVLMEKQNYVEAIKALNAYDKLNSDVDALYAKGVCAYHLNQPQQCIDLMVDAFKKGCDKDDIYLYTARSYQALGNYSEAAVYFKNQLNLMQDEKGGAVAEIINEIKRCEFSPKIKHLPQLAYVDNFGGAANSSYDEVSPLQSPNFQNKYYFSSNREQSNGGPRDKWGDKDELSNIYYYDMYAVELAGGNYTPITAFNTIQNTTQNEIIQDFSKDGSVMYYLRHTTAAFKLMTDTFVSQETMEVAEGALVSPFDPLSGDRDLSVFNDSTLVFSSNRAGGFGGYDIYVCKKAAGIWQDPVNLGAGVNSNYNERSPYITKGGHALFFSSDFINGLGGFDIFASKYDPASKKWSERINLGIPINSSKDDIDPLVSNDGNQLLFSSNRLDGFGGFDLYMAYFKEQITDQFNYIEELPMFAVENLNENGTNGEVVQANKTEVKKVVVAPIYFTGDEDVLSPQNITALKTVRNILEVYPGTKIKILGHSAVDKQKETSLFFTIKRLERLASNLASSGISASRIELHSHGSSFPMVVNESRYNSRIELMVTDLDPKVMEITEDFPVLKEDVVNPVFKDYLVLKNGLGYKVRFTVARQMVRSDVLLDFQFTSVMRNAAGDYEYYCGYVESYDEARAMKLRLLEKGYTAAKIVPFVAHEIITGSNIANYLSTYPDLGRYLQEEK
ncbi:MAG: PD40 domain-containing protein [Saprospiraceae bacterium]|nr:PD40 domain-containing protein [Saprospiraceae bacterium]